MDISIVIPAFNRRALLKHTLNSILHSPLRDVPVIVVDNGSTDGTGVFLEEFSKKHDNVTYTTELQKGASAARNRGLSLVKTGWVYFFDSDDEFEDLPHEWDQTADMIAFSTRQILDNRTLKRSYKPASDPAVHILNGLLSTQSMLFRTSWLRDIGGWNTSCPVWNDWELGARALMANPKLQWITDKAYHTIKIHPDSLTGPSFKSRYKLQLETIRQVKADAGKTDPHSASRYFKALMLRTFILSGKLLYEGDKKASAQCREFITGQFGKKPQGYVLGKILEQYTAMGGRGAWRMAVWYITRKRNL